MSKESKTIGGQMTSEGDIVSVVDVTDTGRTFVIADVTRDDSWMSVAEKEAAALEDWR